MSNKCWKQAAGWAGPPGCWRAGLGRSFLAVFVLLAALAAKAAELDVPTPYVPSTPQNVDEMLRLANVHSGDVLYDLGSGDGRVVIAAARDYGARGVGLELDPKLVALSRRNARAAGVADRVEFRQADILKAPLADATVVTFYLLPVLVRQIEGRLYDDLAPGTRIVAHEYPLPHWRADRHIVVSKNFYLYVVPARIGGRWQLVADAAGRQRRYDLSFEQRYQEVKGAAQVQGGILPAFEAKIDGRRVSFILMDEDVTYRYEGAVHGDRMDGVVRWGLGSKLGEGQWHATRTPAS